MSRTRQAKGRQESRQSTPRRDGYLAWSRDPAVGLFAVLPLWLCYEVLRFSLTPYERNGAEALITDVLGLLGPSAVLWLRVLFGLLVIASAIVLLRRRIPWLRVCLVNALEGTVYALILGPLSAAVAASSERLLGMNAPSDALVYNLVGSLGAGIFEELVFRFLLMSVLVFGLARLAESFAVPRIVGTLAAVILSALLFSLFHHLGPGAAAFDRQQFVFRAIAGVVLGLLFALRGFGVCVYTHAMYDVHYYLTSG